jgi:hypothetical protein
MVATAGDMAVLAKAMAARDQRRRQLEQDLALVSGSARTSRSDVGRLERDLRARLKDWRGTLQRKTPLTRQLLMKLVDGNRQRLTVGVVRPEGLEPPAYWFEASRSIQLSYGRGLMSVVHAPRAGQELRVHAISSLC